MELDRLRGSEAGLVLAHAPDDSVFRCSIKLGFAADLETGLELSQVRCRDEGRAAVASNEVLVPSLQMRPWMETLAPISTSEGDAVSC